MTWKGVSSFIKESSLCNSSFIAFSISLFSVWNIVSVLSWGYWSGICPFPEEGKLSFRNNVSLWCFFPPLGNWKWAEVYIYRELSVLLLCYLRTCTFLWNFVHLFFKKQKYWEVSWNLFDSCACICWCAHYLSSEKHTPHISDA